MKRGENQNGRRGGTILKRRKERKSNARKKNNARKRETLKTTRRVKLKSQKLQGKPKNSEEQAIGRKHTQSLLREVIKKGRTGTSRGESMAAENKKKRRKKREKKEKGGENKSGVKKRKSEKRGRRITSKKKRKG